jgi:predicted transcriptional regulator
MSKKLTHKHLKKIALSKPAVKAEYNALKEEFALIEEMIKARYKACKTQEDVAKQMGTTTSVIGRLEGGGAKRHSPSVATLKRYAEAVGCILQIKLVRKKRFCE